jgi:hypothetical protein
MTKTKPPGGRPGLTLEDVRAACARLEQEGRQVSLLNVRYELTRGSYSTIQKYLQELGYLSAGPQRKKKP